MFKRLLLAVVALLLVWLGYEWLTFPDVGQLASEPPKTTAFMDLRRQELRAAGKDDTLQYHWVAYEKISPYLRRAALVGEDDTFFEHGAVNQKGLQEAIEKDWKRKKITHGGSTITQQLAKNLYLSPSRNPIRKIKEYFIARALESHLSKKRILEIYLNVVEMGERVYGADAAAHYYFHVPASALTPPQAALLAGCLPNPRIMNPGSPNKRLRFRQRMILSRMRRWGYMFEKEVLTAPKPKAAPVTPETTTAPAPADTAPLQQTPPTDTATPAVPDTAAPSKETPPTETAAPSTATEPPATETTSSAPTTQ